MGTATGTIAGTEQTGLSKLAAPPSKPQTLAPGCVGCLVSAAFWFFLMSIVAQVVPPEANFVIGIIAMVVAACVAWFVAASVVNGLNLRQRYAEKHANWKNQHDTWRKSFMCMKCGHIFVVSDFDPPPDSDALAT